MTTLSLLPLLAWTAPSLEMILITILGASLPVGFFLWMNWWLSSVKDENPDKVIAEQAKADQEHRKHHGHHGGHGDSHHAAHA